MHKNKNVRMGISLLLSFFLAAAFFLVYASLVIKIGFLPGNAWQSYLRGSGYGSKMSEEAEEKLTKLLEGYGLPVGVAEELISQETLQMEYSRWLEDCWKSEKRIRRTGILEKIAYRRKHQKKICNEGKYLKNG